MVEWVFFICCWFVVLSIGVIECILKWFNLVLMVV